MYNNDNFGAKLRQLRESKNLSQATTANILEITALAYNKYENNKIFPSKKKLIKICRFFKTSVDDLMLDAFTSAEFFWIQKGYEVNVGENGAVSLTLPVPSVSRTIQDGQIITVTGEKRRINFADKQAFISVTKEIKSKCRRDYIAQCNEEALNLYHKIEEEKTDNLTASTVPFNASFVST